MFLLKSPRKDMLRDYNILSALDRGKHCRPDLYDEAVYQS